MWAKILEWLKAVFIGVVPVQPEEPIPEYKTPEVWPYDSPRPPNELIHKLNMGFETVGDHIMYRSQDTGRFAGQITWEDQMWLVKHLTYWLAGGTLLEGHKFETIRSTCGWQKCCRPDHLKPKYAPSKKVKAKPKPKQRKPKLDVNMVAGPPEYKTKPKVVHLSSKTADDLLGGDRTKCVSAKVYFRDDAEAKEVAAEWNRRFRTPGGRKLYGYHCDWCGGGHLTKQNPETRPKYKHKGSWS